MSKGQPYNDIKIVFDMSLTSLGRNFLACADFIGNEAILARFRVALRRKLECYKHESGWAKTCKGKIGYQTQLGNVLGKLEK